MNKKTVLRSAWSVTTVVLARLRFVAVFVVAALVVGYWENITNHVDKWTRPPVSPDALAHVHAGDTEFYCPMHPDVVRQDAGNCPKCGMPLVKRKRGQEQVLPADVLARVQLTPQRVALANIGTTPVAYKPLVRDVRALGVLDYDETKLARISARVPGRVEKLFVTYAGQPVTAGEPLFSIYSPEVYAALREYLTVRTSASAATQPAGADVLALAEASRRRLLLWGVTEQQLDALAKQFEQTGRVPTELPVSSPIGGVVVAKDVYEGAYVQTGDSVYTVADLSRLWLQVKLYERDVPLVEVGTRADVTVDALPGEALAGVVTFKAVAFDPATRTLDARVEVENKHGKLRPGMYAMAKLRIPIKPKAEVTATAPAVTAERAAAAITAALVPYRKASDALAADSTENVAELVKQTVAALQPLAVTPELAAQLERMGAAPVKPDAPIREVRSGFREVSAALIEIARAVGLPDAAGAVQVVRCSMSKGSWIEPRTGSPTLNPYMGKKMLTCGDLEPDLPAFAAAKFPAPAAKPDAPAGLVLAVPTSAVIDTGPGKIVYVESAPGVFDMRAVTVGPEAAGQYPVLDGLDEGEKVVTVGTFLVDAENRLNPQAANKPAAATKPGVPDVHKHQH